VIGGRGIKSLEIEEEVEKGFVRGKVWREDKKTTNEEK